MDDIAADLRISKKTIYTNFSDKKGLVLECVRTEAESGKEKVDRVEKKAATPLEAVLLINLEILSQVINRCPAFYRDLESFPEAKLKVYDKYISDIRAKYVELFFSCTNDALFSSNVNTHLLLDFFIEQTQASVEKHQSGQRGITSLHIDTISTFLGGVCTEKGRQVLSIFRSKKL